MSEQMTRQLHCPFVPFPNHKQTQSTGLPELFFSKSLAILHCGLVLNICNYLSLCRWRSKQNQNSLGGRGEYKRRDEGSPFCDEGTVAIADCGLSVSVSCVSGHMSYEKSHAGRTMLNCSSYSLPSDCGAAVIFM